MGAFRIFVAAAALAAVVPGVAPAQSEARASETGASLRARVVIPSVARAAPHDGARPVLRLEGYTTWTGGPQELMVTGRVRHRGSDWVRVQLPVRPNGANGWVRARTVRLVGTRIRFEVHLGSRRLEVWRGGTLLERVSAGIGRAATPTPTGRYAIQDSFATPSAWRGLYGSHVLALTAHSPTLRTFMGGDATVAIHGAGSGRSWRVGAVSSFGCVILDDAALARAFSHARPGVPVIIDRS